MILSIISKDFIKYSSGNPHQWQFHLKIFHYTFPGEDFRHKTIKIFMGIFITSTDFTSSAKRQTFEGFRASLISGEWTKYIPPKFTV